MIYDAERDIISSMKKTICTLLILLLVMGACVGAFACKASIQTDKAYQRYVYDARTDSFVKMGTSIVFTDDFKGFEYSFGGDAITIYGTVEHTDTPESYIITCNEEAISVVSKRYRETLIAGGADQTQIDFYDAVAANLTPKTQYYVYDGKLFTADAIELFRKAEDGSDSFEGLYRMSSSEDLVRLRGGYAYTKDEDGEYTYKNGRYTVSRGILTLVTLDENGKDKYQDGVLMRKRYLMAKVTVPSDGELVETSLEEQLQTSAFVSKITADISAYSGKTIAVLCDEFLSKDME